MTKKALQEIEAVPITTDAAGALLTRAEFHQLSNVPPAVEWFADIDNPDTRAAYQADVENGADLRIGASGTSYVETTRKNLFCVVKIENKTPIYWAIEKGDLELVEAIAARLEGNYNKAFRIKQTSLHGLTIISLGLLGPSNEIVQPALAWT
jgi:hypothetical protein